MEQTTQQTGRIGSRQFSLSALLNGDFRPTALLAFLCVGCFVSTLVVFPGALILIVFPPSVRAEPDAPADDGRDPGS